MKAGAAWVVAALIAAGAGPAEAPTAGPRSTPRVRPRIRVPASAPWWLNADDSNSSYGALGLCPCLLPEGAPGWAEDGARRAAAVIYKILH